jgi:hypothetical protein
MANILFPGVLAGAIAIVPLASGEEPRLAKSDDLKTTELRRDKKGGNLADRCKKMLDLQVAVYDCTKDLNKVVQDKKPRPKDMRISEKLSKDQKAIIAEVTTAIDMLKAEGAAAAFVEVLDQLRSDMKRVQGRLEMSEVGSVTQAIETDVIDTLKEMIRALQAR